MTTTWTGWKKEWMTDCIASSHTVCSFHFITRDKTTMIRSNCDAMRCDEEVKWRDETINSHKPMRKKRWMMISCENYVQNRETRKGMFGLLFLVLLGQFLIGFMAELNDWTLNRTDSLTSQQHRLWDRDANK